LRSRTGSARSLSCLSCGVYAIHGARRKIAVPRVPAVIAAARGDRADHVRAFPAPGRSQCTKPSLRGREKMRRPWPMSSLPLSRAIWFVAYVLLVVYASLHRSPAGATGVCRRLPSFAAPSLGPMQVLMFVVNVIGLRPAVFSRRWRPIPGCAAAAHCIRGFACSLLLSFALESLQLSLFRPARPRPRSARLTPRAERPERWPRSSGPARCASRRTETPARRFMLPGRRVDLGSC